MYTRSKSCGDLTVIMPLAKTSTLSTRPQTEQNTDSHASSAVSQLESLSSCTPAPHSLDPELSHANLVPATANSDGTSSY